jgi:hypothetical protein
MKKILADRRDSDPVNRPLPELKVSQTAEKEWSIRQEQQRFQAMLEMVANQRPDPAMAPSAFAEQQQRLSLLHQQVQFSQLPPPVPGVDFIYHHFVRKIFGAKCLLHKSIDKILFSEIC